MKHIHYHSTKEDSINTILQSIEITHLDRVAHKTQISHHFYLIVMSNINSQENIKKIK